MKQYLEKLKRLFPLSLRDFVIFILSMGAGAALCLALQKVSESDVHVPMIFVLIVLIISLTTDGYFFGSLAAVVSVFAVNWAFTYPYMKLDFSIYGYPLTFITFLAVGITCSTLASRIQEQQKLRLETEREKTRANLLRSVSHDLRTPLTAISGSVTAVLEDESLPDEARRELLENARRDADWLYRMVENLLSITRISGGGAGDIIKTEEMPEEVFGEAARKFKSRNPGISVEISVPEEAIFVPMDVMLVEQVLLNLMDNAVIHGQSTTEISIRLTDGEEFVTVSVRDNGKGIAPKLLGHLFDGSMQAGTGAKTDSSRFMGIGLTVCRTIVEAHGGEITAENTPGGGAEFRFTLKKGEGYEYT